MLFNTILEEIKDFDTAKLSDTRVAVLSPLIDFIQNKVDLNLPIQLNFICTHNSRRSHLAQVWAQTMSHHFGVKNVTCYSGGTEATALFPMVVDTLLKSGFKIETGSDSKNPKYQIKYAADQTGIVGFSKVFDDPFNPKSEFAAVMTCNHADKNCPFVPGTEQRIAVTYNDPKEFDGTPQQVEKYQERSFQIAQEMYFVFSKINQK